MKYRSLAVAVLVAGLTLGVAAPASSTTSSAVLNGDFEADAVGSTSVSSWTVINDIIDLGVDSIEGCLTVDTSDYTTLRDYAAELYENEFEDALEASYVEEYAFDEVYYYETLDGDPVNIGPHRLVHDYDTDLWGYYDTVNSLLVLEDAWDPSYNALLDAILDPIRSTAEAAVAAQDPTVLQDNVSTIPGFFDESEYSVTVVDSESSIYFEEEEVPLGRDGKVLELYSDVDSDEEDGGYGGYVTHGPAVVSSAFTVPTGREIRFDWFASDVSDDFHVFGYLLNTATCEQTEVIDATGEIQEWTTTAVSIPAAGTYKFVFISGSFDQSFGLAAGALLYIDDIVQTVSFGGEPGVDLSLTAGVGDYLPGSAVDIAGGNLRSESDYDLTLRSTPVVVATGVADGDGNFNSTVDLPSSIAPGKHTITLRGIAPSGQELTDTAYVTVGSGGTLLYLSYTGAEGAALAATGQNGVSGLLAAGGTLFALGLLLAVMSLRRREAAS